MLLGRMFSKYINHINYKMRDVTIEAAYKPFESKWCDLQYIQIKH